MKGLEKEKEMARNKSTDLQSQLSEQEKNMKETQTEKERLMKELDVTKNQLQLVKVRDEQNNHRKYVKYAMANYEKEEKILVISRARNM